MDLCGNTLLVVNDREAKDLGSIMYVISIANRTSPVVSANLRRSDSEKSISSRS